MAVCGALLLSTVTTAAVADCDASADFDRDFYDGSFGIAYDVNSAGNSELFAIEVLCATGPPGDAMRAELRNTRSRPIIKQIELWALSIRELPGSGLRKAIEYMGGLWKGLSVFLDDPRVPLHC